MSHDKAVTADPESFVASVTRLDAEEKSAQHTVESALQEREKELQATRDEVEKIIDDAHKKSAEEKAAVVAAGKAEVRKKAEKIVDDAKKTAAQVLSRKADASKAAAKISKEFQDELYSKA